MNGLWNSRRRAACWSCAGMLAAAIGGCGGGGGGDGGTPTTPGNYAGSYHCNNDNNNGAVWDSTLATASGAFGTCGGRTDSGFALTCTGSISAQGTFVLDGQDPRGYVTTMRGTVSGSAATGDYTVTGVGLSGTFTCVHT